jgi:predicted nucleotidyltransferase
MAAMVFAWIGESRARVGTGPRVVAARRDAGDVISGVRFHGIEFPEERIAAFCREHGVARLSLFGSTLREASPEGGDGFRPTSDVDVLVEFLSGRTPILLRFAGMQLQLGAMLGREEQLSTPAMLSRYSRDRVMREARPLQAA